MMVERYAHVAPETLQGAAGRLDALGPLLLGYDAQVVEAPSGEQESLVAPGTMVPKRKRER